MARRKARRTGLRRRDRGAQGRPPSCSQHGPDPGGDFLMSQARDADPGSQDLADVFRGDAEAGYSLKDANSGKGISAKSVPAFVAGEELADLADDDERIAVLTAD